jgi:hypothetical protein
MRKRIQKYVLLAAGAILLIFLMQQINWLPSFSDVFKSKPVVIDKTPVLVEEINELAQLITVTSYDEVVADSVVIDPKKITLKTMPGISIYPFSPLFDRLVIIAKGKVVAGIKLSSISEKDILILEDSVSLIMPSAKILDAVINPADIETFSETGTWDNNAVTKVKIKAREKMIKRALDKGIIGKATEKGKALLENFLRKAGYKKVHVIVRG